MLLSIFCGGHALIVGVPGLAKTLLVRCLAQTLHLSFSRIQFTPDLMPSDITGTEIIQEDPASGGSSFKEPRKWVTRKLVVKKPAAAPGTQIRRPSIAARLLQRLVKIAFRRTHRTEPN